MQLTLTFKEGSTNLDIAAALRYQANLIDGTKNLAKPAEPLTADEDAEETPAPKKTKAKAAPKVKAAETFEEDEETEATEESFEEESFEDETPAPKKTKAAAAKKITIDEVNDVCKAFARENGGGKDGREAVLKILKKSFKVTSISELDVEDYPKVLKALAV